MIDSIPTAFRQAGSITGENPGFSELAQCFQLQPGVPCLNRSTELHPAAVAHAVTRQYVKHQQGEPRIEINSPVLGACEVLPQIFCATVGAQANDL